MKKIFLSMVTAAMTLAGFTACEKDLEVYHDSTSRLNFYYPAVSNTSQWEEGLNQSAYSFIHLADDVVRDTVWFEVETMGFVSKTDRPIALEQVATEGNNAVAGTHYEAFDSPSLKSHYIMPAGKTRTKLPVVVLRDPSLKTSTVQLQFRLQGNEAFQPGYEVFQTRVLTITDRLSQPANWTKDYPSGTKVVRFSNYFGAWGEAKYKFLLNHSDFGWDDAYIDYFMKADNAYKTYVVMKMQYLLNDLNAERKAKGLGVLTEADGTVVVLYKNYMNY